MYYGLVFCAFSWPYMVNWHNSGIINDIVHISFQHSFTPHGLIRTHRLPAPNVSGSISQLVRAAHRCREVTGLNPVEVLFTIARITVFGFVINYTFWTKRQNWKAIHTIFWPPFAVRRARLCPPNQVFFFTNHPPIRVSEFDWQSRLIWTPLQEFLSWRFCTQLSNVKVYGLATARRVAL